MNLSQLAKEINNSSLSIEELSQLNALVVNKVKSIRKANSIMNASILAIGQKVKLNHPRMLGKEFEITQIRKTKCSVQEIGGNGSYSVPMSMVIA